MRASIDVATKRDRPTLDEIVEATGPLTNSAPNANPSEGRERGRGRRSAE